MIPLKDDIPTRTYPTVTVLLIVLNAVIYLADWALGGALSYRYAMVPGLVSHFPLEVWPRSGLPVWTMVFTSMFLHGSFMHVGGNMLYLWIFGNNTEDRLGHVRFLLFYFVCGVAAAAVHILLGWNSRVPTLGASGAIAGVLGAYIYLFPYARITTIVPIFFIGWIMELPAITVLGFWFILNLYNTILSTAATMGGGQQSGGVAFGAHVGGFLAGWLLIRLLERQRPEPYCNRGRPPFFDDQWR